MRIGTRVLFGVLFVVSLGFYFLVDWINEDLTPRYRESTEEPLVDAARVFAAIAAQTVRDGKPDIELFRAAFTNATSQTFVADIYGFLKTDVDFRVYITDQSGIVIFDSDRGGAEGEDYSTWRDVRLTLEGEYGARTSRDIPGNPSASVMYVAAPIQVNGDIIGVLTVGKPTHNANQLLAAAQRKVIFAGTAVASTVLFVWLFLSWMLTRPIQRLMTYARAVRDGKRVVLPPLGTSEIAELGQAFEQMRDALEGKQYVEQYVQALTHEIKSPLSAIRGAAELLQEPMDEEQRNRFVRNIRSEAARIQVAVDTLLQLSAIENRRGLQDLEPIDTSALAEELRDHFSESAKHRGITLRVAGNGTELLAERYLLQLALTNVVQNAVEFSPPGGRVDITIDADPDQVIFQVDDQGPGIPEYAADKVFDRFYSLKRPETGKKSSGLGLSIVREITMLHRGSVSLENRQEGGCRVILRFPRDCKPE